MENLIFSLNATIPIFLVMVIGYILKNIKFLDEPFVKTLNSFNFKITLPVLLFRDIAGSDFLEVWDGKYVMFCFLVTLFCTIKRTRRENLYRLLIEAVQPSLALLLSKTFTAIPAWHPL